MLVLGAHNFEAATERFILMLVLLYTPGCDGCAALTEEYVQVSDQLYEHLIPVAKVGPRRGVHKPVFWPWVMEGDVVPCGDSVDSGKRRREGTVA